MPRVSDAFDGFLSLFLSEAARDPTRVFASFEGRSVTLGELDGASAALASALHAHGPDTRVAVMMGNGPRTLAVLFAIARAGAVWVPVNARLRGEGLRYVLGHSEPRVLIVDADLLSTVAACGADLAAVSTIVAGDAGDTLDALLRGPAPRSPDPDLPGPEAPFAIMYTSGTTGPPKGVIVTHRMMRLAGEAVAHLSDARSGDTFFVWEPLYHIGGAQLIVLPLIRPVRLAMVARFSASRFWDEVRAQRATQIHYLGGILQLLLKQPPRLDDASHDVRIAWGGGCPTDIWRPFEARFGVAIRECYGMTEASSLTTGNDAGVVGSVGRPLPWFQVDLRDRDGAPTSAGDAGEIVVRTSLPGAIFPGYFRNEEASAKALRDGALHTGDLGRFDADGNLLFLGRMGDSVRCRGENVSAWEVERVAAAHPDIADCAMIGVAASIGEQDIKLFVQGRAGASLDPRALFAWLAERLAPYQVPRYLAVVDAFERTPSERIMKHRLSPSLDDGWTRPDP